MTEPCDSHEPYKSMYYRLFNKTSDLHELLQSLLREMEMSMQELEEQYISSEAHIDINAGDQ